MAIALHRGPFKVIYLFSLFIGEVFIQFPCWLIYYSWRPNRPRKTWTLCHTIHVRILQNLTPLLFRLGLCVGRDLSLEVPQKALDSLNATFVRIPDPEKDDIVGIVGEHAARAGIKSIIPAYWILREGTRAREIPGG